MKTIFIALLLTTTISIAQASVSERCDALADLAESTMELRQAGIPLSKVLEIMGDETLYKTMTIQAYKQPVWRVEENKINAIAEYRNEWHLACLDME